MRKDAHGWRQIYDGNILYSWKQLQTTSILLFNIHSNFHFNLCFHFLLPCLFLCNYLFFSFFYLFFFTPPFALFLSLPHSLCRYAFPNSRFLMARTGLEDAIQGQSVDIGLAVKEVRTCWKLNCSNVYPFIFWFFSDHFFIFLSTFIVFFLKLVKKKSLWFLLFIFIFLVCWIIINSCYCEFCFFEYPLVINYLFVYSRLCSQFYLFIYLFINLFILSFIYLFICLFNCLFIYLFVCLFVDLLFYWLIYRSNLKDILILKFETFIICCYL